MRYVAAGPGSAIMQGDPLTTSSPFRESAAVYDLLESANGKDYAAEAERLLALIEGVAPGATSMLDVACGTGRHLEQLAPQLEVAGVDRSFAMVEIAHQRCPSARFVVADMRCLPIRRRFGVVTCLFSSIGYMTTPDALDAAMVELTRMVEPDGGVLIVEPWIQPDMWVDAPAVTVAAIWGDRKVTRTSTISRGGTTSWMESRYVFEDMDGMEQFVEVHEMGLFSRERYIEAVARTGLRPQWHEGGLIGRGLLIALASSDRRATSSLGRGGAAALPGRPVTRS